MKTATLSAIATGESPGYAWTWRCEADGYSSSGAFALYYDCLNDARLHGYDVRLVQAYGAMAPGGVAYALSAMRK